MKRISVRIYNIQWAGDELNDCDWYCDECGDHLNAQVGFDTIFATWECEKCGYENEINSDNIRGLNLPSSDDAYFDCEEYELLEEITSYLQFKYNHDVAYFDFDITNIDDDERMSDDDYELADFCHGGDLSED